MKLSPISTPSRSIVKFSGIFSLGHFNSTFLLTIFNTPPLFNPGDFSWFIKLTGTSIVIFTPGNTLKKSTWVGSSLIIWYFTSLGKTFWGFPSTFRVIIFDKKFSFSIKALRNFLEIEIFWFWSFPPYIIPGTLPLFLMAFNWPLVELSRILASNEFIKQSFLTHVYK